MFEFSLNVPDLKIFFREVLLNRLALISYAFIAMVKKTKKCFPGRRKYEICNCLIFLSKISGTVFQKMLDIRILRTGKLA